MDCNSIIEILSQYFKMEISNKIEILNNEIIVNLENDKIVKIKVTELN
mgnify:CR=1 FL=1